MEINGSSYSRRTPATYRRWGGRFVTHPKRLRDVEVPLANLSVSGVTALGEKLGPALWRPPPQLPYDRERPEHLLRLLPRTGAEASAIAAPVGATCAR